MQTCAAHAHRVYRSLPAASMHVAAVSSKVVPPDWIDLARARNRGGPSERVRIEGPPPYETAASREKSAIVAPRLAPLAMVVLKGSFD